MAHDSQSIEIFRARPKTLHSCLFIEIQGEEIQVLGDSLGMAVLWHRNGCEIGIGYWVGVWIPAPLPLSCVVPHL